MLTRDIKKIIQNIKDNNIVSIPTDTVYGLSCQINKTAIEKIIALKKRELNKGFIIISHDYKHLLKHIDTSKLTDNNIMQISTRQQQPTTWIVPSNKNMLWLTGGRESIAIRLVNTKTVEHICSYLDDAIISTSANISGKKSISDPKLISHTFSNIHVLETSTDASQASKIIDIITGKQIR